MLPALLAGCAAPDSLQVSKVPGRTSAVPLAGASVTGNVFVFLPSASGITKVAFTLDGALAPTSVDSAAPWDLGGTAASGGGAVAFDTSRLAAGAHHLVAHVNRGTAVSDVPAYFTVVRPPVTGTSTTPAAVPFSRTAGRPWAATSPFNTALPANPVLASNSPAVSAYLSGGSNQQIANLYDFGWPVFYADASTPKGIVRSTMDWGTDPFGGQPVPLPAGLQANPGSDGHAIVVDWSTGRAYEFWQLKKIDSTHWTMSWGQITPDVRAGLGNATVFGGSSKGSGLSGLGGLVRSYEMRQGVIDHALEFASDAVTPTAFRFPATKTDGTNMAGMPLGMTIPEGGRVRLDPSINLAAIPGITRGELIVGKALQKYGAFCSDQGGARMSFGFENPLGDTAGNPYPGVGFNWDYYQMGHLPWNKLQVLRQSDGK